MTTAPVIFLDFDGVLIGPDDASSNSAIRELTQLCRHTGAALIFITSLRYRFDVAQLHAMMLQNGFDATLPFVGEVRDLSDWRDAVGRGQWPSQKRLSKAEEIAAFLEANPEIERFVIIDDDDPRKFAPYEDFTVSPCGVFSAEDRLAAIALLTKSDSP